MRRNKGAKTLFGLLLEEEMLDADLLTLVASDPRRWLLRWRYGVDEDTGNKDIACVTVILKRISCPCPAQAGGVCRYVGFAVDYQYMRQVCGWLPVRTEAPDLLQFTESKPTLHHERQREIPRELNQHERG